MGKKVSNLMEFNVLSYVSFLPFHHSLHCTQNRMIGKFFLKNWFLVESGENFNVF
jgi:hypothetical protein